MVENMLDHVDVILDVFCQHLHPRGQLSTAFYQVQKSIGTYTIRPKKQCCVSPPAHLNYFSHDTLENFLNKNNFSVVKRESSFPFEIFLLFGDNYVSDRTLGKECHKKRINFEQNFLKTRNEKYLDKFYEKLAEINLGRTAIIYAKNK